MKKLNYLSYSEAYQSAIDAAAVQESAQIVLIGDALDRVLAEDIIVRKNLPSFNNSAMDGFAFRYEDRGKRLTVITTVLAGDKVEPRLMEGSCYRIMTGAQVPDDADTIVPIENCSDVTKEAVTIPENIQKGSAFRSKGEEQKVGNILFRKGARITPSHIALLSAQGIMAVTVYKALEIAVVSTGDEIREPWEKASEDEIYNANAFAITSLLKKYGFSAEYAGSIPDSLEASSTYIGKLKHYDVLITTGGISMGDADFLEEAFVRNGLKALFHGIDVKPGRPTMMGKMEETFVMAMPGNPLTAMVNTFLLTLPILTKMQGVESFHHAFVYAKNRQSFKMKPGRVNVVLGELQNGEFTVTRNNKYGSGMLTPMVESNALALFNEERSGVGEDEMVKVVLFDDIPAATNNFTIN